MMRIISGTFRGKKILQPQDKNTRPLKDLTKESIFNLIEHSKKFNINLKNSVVFDLFSGVGSFGLECLSREAKYVFFFENYIGVLPLLKKNLNNLKSKNNYKVIEKDIFKEETFSNLNKKSKIIFLDPPYQNKNIEKILNIIRNLDLLDKNGIIILHRHKKEIINLPKKYEIIDQRNYGISKIIFLNYLYQ